MTTSLSPGVAVASAALSAGSTVRCGAAASRCVSHAAPTISAAAASSQRFIGIPLCDGPTGTCCGPVVAGSQEGCRALPCLSDRAPVAGAQYSSPRRGRGSRLRRGARRRRAPRGRGDIAVVERQAVVARPRLRLAREAMAIQRLVQPGAARVSREHATGAVRAVRRWRKPDNEQTRSGIAEARYRFAPIHPVRELTLLVARDTPAIGAQPRAARTADDGAVDGGERREQSDASRSEFPP